MTEDKRQDNNPYSWEDITSECLFIRLEPVEGRMMIKHRDDDVHVRSHWLKIHPDEAKKIAEIKKDYLEKEIILFRDSNEILHIRLYRKNYFSLRYEQQEAIDSDKYFVKEIVIN